VLLRIGARVSMRISSPGSHERFWLDLEADEFGPARAVLIEWEDQVTAS